MNRVSWLERLRFLRVFLRAVVSRSWVSKRNVAASYARGEGVPQDEARARRWYARAATAGDSSADYDLGLMLLFGEGGPPEPGRGRALLLRAAEAGDPAAQKFLAYLASHDLGGLGADPEPAEMPELRRGSAAAQGMDVEPIEPE